MNKPDTFSEPGYVADVIALDQSEFAPVASFDSWNRLAVGVVFSIVDGQLVVRDAEFTETLPGRVLRKSK